MRRLIAPTIIATLLAILATVTSCGPSLEQQQAVKDCRDQCGISLANCYESRTCLAIDGQIVPCEEECANEHSNCEADCTGS
jgi:hypothetical protein